MVSVDPTFGATRAADAELLSLGLDDGESHAFFDRLESCPTVCGA